MSNSDSSVEVSDFGADWFIVAPLTEEPTCLGGLPDGVTTAASCAVAMQQPLSKLPRPAALPSGIGTKRADSSLPRGCWTRTAFMEFWEGEFKVRWYDTEDGYFKIRASMVDNDESSIPKEHRHELVSLNIKDVDHGVFFSSQFLDQCFKCAMTEKKQTALANRIFHRVIRSYGARLPWNVVSSVADKFLKAVYGKDKDHEELLFDAAITFSDIAINTNRENNDIVPHLMFVGEMLELRGQFQLAARIYDLVASNYGSKHPSVAVFWSRAAVASNTDGDYGQAEEYNVKALYYHQKQVHAQDCRSGWNINDDIPRSIFGNLWGTYVEMERRGQFDTKDARKLLPALMALLFGAGYDSSASFFMKGLVDLYGKSSYGKIKAHLRSAVQAKKILKAATRHIDVINFRAKLIACFRPDLEIALPGFHDMIGDIDRVDDNTRESALERVQDYISQPSTRAPCSNLGCHQSEFDGQGDINLSWCPCKAVSYCSKSCQEADWKRHKQFCTWLAKKKKAAAGMKDENSK